MTIGVAIATSLAVQLLTSLYIHRRTKAETSFNPSLRSALITALGLSLLLRTDHWSTMTLAATLAILSQFILQVNHKHFFNPANFGIIAVLLLMQDAWVSPEQWGEVGWYGLVIYGRGWYCPASCLTLGHHCRVLGTYTLLGTIRNLWLGWTGMF